MSNYNSESVVSSEFRAETYLADDLSTSSRGVARGAERALMSALLFDGVQAFLNYSCATHPSQRARYREAYTWVATRGNEYIFSFDNVCDCLGVDPDFLRCGLINASNSQSFEWTKIRRVS